MDGHEYFCLENLWLSYDIIISRKKFCNLLYNIFPPFPPSAKIDVNIVFFSLLGTFQRQRKIMLHRFRDQINDLII